MVYTRKDYQVFTLYTKEFHYSLTLQFKIYQEQKKCYDKHACTWRSKSNFNYGVFCITDLVIRIIIFISLKVNSFCKKMKHTLQKARLMRAGR